MTGMDDQRFEVGFTPLPTAARVTRQRSALKWRWVTTIISVAILLAIVYFFPPDWSSWVTWAFAVLWVGSSVFWLVVNLVGLSRAKRDLESISPAPASSSTRRGSSSSPRRRPCCAGGRSMP